MYKKSFENELMKINRLYATYRPLIIAWADLGVDLAIKLRKEKRAFKTLLSGCRKDKQINTKQKALEKYMKLFNKFLNFTEKTIESLEKK